MSHIEYKIDSTSLSFSCLHLSSVNFSLSLKNGICDTSACAFTAFAYFKILLQQDFTQGRYWAGIIINMIELSNVEMITLRHKFFAHLNFWFVPLKDTQHYLRDTYNEGLRVGEIGTAYMLLCLIWRFSFFGGNNLSILSHTIDKHLKAMVSTRMPQI